MHTTHKILVPILNVGEQPWTIFTYVNLITIIYSIKFIVGLVVVIYFLSFFFNFKDFVFKKPVLKKLFDKIILIFQSYQKYKFFIIATGVFVYRVLTILTTPNYGANDFILPVVGYIISLSIAFFVFNYTLSFLEKLPFVGHFFKKKTSTSVRISEIDLNFSYLKPEDFSDELISLEKRYTFLISNLWAFFAILIVLPIGITQYLSSFLDFVIFCFIFYMLWLSVSITNIKTALLITKVEKDVEAFITFKYNLISQNTYLTKKRWAVKFVEDYKEVIFPPVSLGNSRRTIMNAQLREKVIIKLKELASNRNVQRGVLATGVAVGGAAGAVIQTTISSTDENITVLGQKIDQKTHGYHHGHRSTMNAYDELQDGNHINEENKHFFQEKSGRLKEDYVQHAHTQWIKKAPTTDHNFQALFETNPRVSAGSTSEPIAASAPRLDPDLGKTIGETISKNLKKD